MLRQKPVSEKTLQKYCGFLGAVQRSSLPFHGDNTLIDIAKLHHINPATGKAIVDMGIIERLTPTSWKWKAGKKDVTIIAFEVLNINLFKHKKQIHVPIPEFAAFGEALSTIADRLAHISMQNEKWLKQAKTPQIENIDGGDLFHVEDQRLYIAGQIASAMYYGLSSPDNPASYTAANDAVVLATDDLMNKLLKRNHQETGRVIIEEPKPHKLIGLCSICNSEVYEDEPFCGLLDAAHNFEGYFCKDHLPKLNGVDDCSDFIRQDQQ